MDWQDQYSWILYAAQQSYATLSIDRLCNGLSSHLDAISLCQYPLEAETVHALIEQARGGVLLGPSPSRAFDRIIIAGHNVGSLLASYLVRLHPQDADALLLTGYSLNVSNSLPRLPSLDFEPARAVDPSRFGALSSSYLASNNETATRDLFYFSHFNRTMARYDYTHRGTVALGELASIPIGKADSPGYRGKLFVLNGEEDAAFCEASPEAGAAGTPGNCSLGFSQNVTNFFPAASAFAYHNTPDTGHALNLHLTAQESYRAAHNYLDKVRF